MHQQNIVWQFIRSSLQADIPVMLLYVLESSGSSPGRQGFAMATSLDGKMEGSIGGGIMEHKFVEMAKDLLSQSGSVIRPGIRKQFHDKLSARNQSGMICSGEQTNFLYQVTTHDLPAIERIIDCLNGNSRGYLQLSPAGLLFSEDGTITGNFYFTFHHEDDWLYRERIGYKNKLFVVGGGHCSLALCRLMSTMDFYISVYDTRGDLNTMVRNQYAHEQHIVDDYSQLNELIPSGQDHFVVVMTFGYRSDESAVRSLLSNCFGYFGLLGSRSKVEKLLLELKKAAFSPDQLKRIHAPVGLPVNSQTPEEIAVSIAAEIIQVKNGGLKK